MQCADTKRLALTNLAEPLERVVAGAPSFAEGVPLASAIEGLYILRAAADTSVECNSRALQFPIVNALNRTLSGGTVQGFSDPSRQVFPL